MTTIHRRLSDAERAASDAGLTNGQGRCLACGPGGPSDPSKWGGMLAGAGQESCRLCGRPFALTYDPVRYAAAKLDRTRRAHAEYGEPMPEDPEADAACQAMHVAKALGMSPEALTVRIQSDPGFVAAWQRGRDAGL